MRLAVDMFRIFVIIFAYCRVRFHLRLLRSRRYLENWQERRIRKHLRYVYKRSAFFRERLGSAPISSWREIGAIGKKEMMDNFDRLNTVGIQKQEAFSVALEAERTRDFSATIRGITIGLSSGTSGSRGLFMASRLEQWIYAGTVLAKVLPGFFMQKNRIAFFLRANSNLYISVRSRVLQFEYFDLLKSVEHHISKLNEMIPTVVIGPPSLLRQLAEKKLAGVLSIDPQKIISVAEVLDPIDEKFLVKAFGKIIHQIYQATEGFLATTCSKGVLHLNEDVLFVEKEWLASGKQKYHPIITDFNRKTQPIIRYRLNDILTERATPCECGSVLSAVAFIEGRADDLFYLPAKSGTSPVVVYPDFIRRTLLFSSDRIEDYRVVQTGFDRVEIYFSASSEDTEAVCSAIKSEFSELGKKLGFEIPTLALIPSKAFAALENGRKLRRIERQYACVRDDVPSEGNLACLGNRVEIAR